MIGELSESLNRLALVSIIVVAAYLLYLPAELGSAILVPPDSSEYSVSLVNLFEHGRFGFTLNGEWFPSRYAPWFPLSCLTPAYLLCRGNALCFHCAVLFFALLTLVLIHRVGCRLSLGWCSFLPVAILLLAPNFAFYSRVVMTEIPYLAVFALTWLMFARLAAREKVSAGDCAVSGLLVAWLGMIRSSGLPMLLPFAVVLLFKGTDIRWRLKRVFVLAVPSAIYELAGLIYNWWTFGSPFRSGYNFWLPVPYDYPELVFNVSYVAHNLYGLLHEPMMVVTAGAMAVCSGFSFMVLRGRFGGVAENRIYLILFSYLLFGAAVLTGLYLPYYWCDPRFFFPVSFLVTPLLLYCVSRVARKGVPYAVLVAGIVIGAGFYASDPMYLCFSLRRPVDLCENQIAAEVLPENSVVIKNGDPNVMDHFSFRRHNLELFPFVDGFDYVSQMVSTSSIRQARSAPSDWREKVIPELVDGGLCRRPFPDTFIVNPARVFDYLAEGKRVFIQESLHSDTDRVDFGHIVSVLKGMGIDSTLFGSWEVPPVVADPVRHLYDRFLFRRYSMDTRPAVTVVYRELSRAEEGK